MADVTHSEGGARPEGRRGGGRRRAAALLMLVAAVAAIVAVVLMGPKAPDKPADDWYDDGVTFTDYTGWSDEDIDADMNAKIAENEMNCTIMATIEVNPETGAANIGVRNIEANHFDQKLTLALDDGTVLYESGGIAPGQSLDAVRLTNVPPAGEHAGTATFQGYNPETHETHGGTASFKVTFVVPEAAPAE